MTKWQIETAVAGSGELTDLLAEGWKPFAVTEGTTWNFDDNAQRSRPEPVDVYHLRREAP